jgi:hypothetical protein
LSNAFLSKIHFLRAGEAFLKVFRPIADTEEGNGKWRNRSRPAGSYDAPFRLLTATKVQIYWSPSDERHV